MHSVWLPSITKLRAPQWLGGNSRKLILAAVVCACLLCADLLLYGLVVSPSAARLGAGEIKFAELRRRHAETVLFQKQRRQFTGILAGIPAQKDMPIMVKDFVQTARRLNLSVAPIKYDMPGRVGGELTPLTFSFSTEGRYAALKRFIYDVETTDRPIGIRELKLAGDKGTGRLDMKLITYIKDR
jgi:Tfp pilus assembly protein PilO